jgi:O6-methylguanine-DNA--protein-cysteine methyltransferase
VISHASSGSARAILSSPKWEQDAIQAESLDSDERNWRELCDIPTGNIKSYRNPCTRLDRP